MKTYEFTYYEEVDTNRDLSTKTIKAPDKMLAESHFKKWCYENKVGAQITDVKEVG